MSSSVAHFDYCTADTWSMHWINEILRILGCERDGRLHVYWLLPGKDCTDGLVPIENQSDIRQMINASKWNKTLCMFIDHTDFLKTLRPDVIVRPSNVHGRNPIPPASASMASASGHAPSSNASMSSASGHAPFSIPPTPNAHDEEGESDNDECQDSDFYDSDFDVEDGDDDLFADNIDKSVNDHNEKEVCVEQEDEAALEDDDLNIGEEQQMHLKKMIKPFNPEVDMDNPIFKNGMKFSCVEELRKALTTYAIRNRKKINKIKNERRRLEAVCAPGCTWLLRSSNDTKRTGGFVITAYEGKHTCEGSWPLKAITAKILSGKFMHEFRDNQKLSLQSFAAKVIREFKMCPPRWKLRRARQDALAVIHGDEEGQFKQLLDYGQELKRSNPGSKFFVTTNSVNDQESPEHREHLATVYWSYDACKRGFLAGCRPFICLDGCHIKTRYKGVLLTAVGIDPNDCIYPVAFGLCEVECTSSWEWFLKNIKDDLNITNTAPWTIMSDKQKVLVLRYIIVTVFKWHFLYDLIKH